MGQDCTAQKSGAPVSAFYNHIKKTPTRVRKHHKKSKVYLFLISYITHSHKGIDVGSCFGMGLHRLKSGAPTSAFYDHSKKTHPSGYGNFISQLSNAASICVTIHTRQGTATSDGSMSIDCTVGYNTHPQGYGN